MNAGFSEAGQEFAAELCDWIFIVSDRPTDYASVARRAEAIRARAEARGRRVKVCMHPMERALQDFLFLGTFHSGDAGAHWPRVWGEALNEMMVARCIEEGGAFLSQRLRVYHPANVGDDA